jgi:alkylation response protein AidB-like acyl-CoA dehydrogenase
VGDLLGEDHFEIGSPVAQRTFSPFSRRLEARSSPHFSWNVASHVASEEAGGETRIPGVSSGAEEHKMGMKGSSTTAVYLDKVGRGHIIAFNILNIGRLKLGPAAVGGAKNVLAICLIYAKQRKAFGSAIAQFGAIQYKLAEIAIRTFVVESMVWRVVGLIQRQLEAAHGHAQDTQAEMKALEEFAAECSIIKV